ncbi:MAG: PQQ-binding-like beta-propeller repeat protein [Phycisphaerales bacterium]
MTLTLAGGVTACSSTQTSSSAPDSSGADTLQVESWTIDHDGWGELGYQWQWTGFPLMKPGAGLTDAVAYNDAIITTASDTTVTCLESSTGKVRWAKQLDRPTTQLFEPERVGNTLFITSDTELHEINLKNGNTLDRDNVNAIINTKPLVMGNLAMFGTTRNQLIAFELTNDFPLWSYKFNGEFQSAPVAIDDRSIAMISAGGDLRTLATYDGSSIMSTKIAGGAVSNLLIDQGAVIVPSTDQSIYSFSLEDGYRYWRKRTSESVTVQPVVHDGIIYGSTADLGLVAIDSISGDILWSNDQLVGWVVSLANDDELMVWTGRDLAAVDIDTGEVITSVNLNGAAGVRADSFIDGSLYVITPNGAIARFSLR